MNFFANYSIKSPFFLIIAIIFIIIFAMYYFLNKPKQNFIDIELIQEIYKGQSLWYRSYIFLLLTISMLMFFLFSWLYLENGKQIIKKNGIDIEIVFDVSYSMIAQDIKPNRLEVAKWVFWDFVSNLTSDRVGLILFAGKPFQSTPLTYDYWFLKSFISDISVDTLYQWNSQLQWTAIWDGLVLAADILTSHENQREKIIILITDGEANKWVKPELALKFLKDKKIKTYTIWVWKDEETTIVIPSTMGFSQQMLVWPVDEEILIKIANETWGRYFRADSKKSLSEILEIIWKLEKKELELETYIFYEDKSYIILLLLLLLYIPLFLIVFFKKIHI